MNLRKKLGIQGFFALLAVFGILGALLLNIIFGILSQKYPLRMDLTPNKAYALDQQTIEYIQELKEPVKIKLLARESLFANTSAYNAQANEVLKELAKQSDLVELEYIDYLKNPSFSANYPELSIKHGDIIVVSGDKYKLIVTENLFNYTVSSSGSLAIASSKAEEAVLSAILGVTSGEKTSICIITGHSESNQQSFLTLLENNNYEVSYSNIVTQEINENSKAAFLLAPATDFSEEELKKLESYLFNNGNYGKTLFYLADAAQLPLPNLEAFLREWGVATGGGAVFETEPEKVFNYQPFFPIAEYVNEDFKPKSKNAPVLVPMSRPVEVVFEYRDYYSTSVLLMFSESSGVRPPDADESFTAADAKQHGPFPAMVLSSKTVTDRSSGKEIGKSNIVVCGSVNFTSKESLENPGVLNAEYMLNMLNTLTERGDMFQIKPKSLTAQGLNITKAKADLIGSVFIFGIPVLILITGAVVFFIRRHE